MPAVKKCLYEHFKLLTYGALMFEWVAVQEEIRDPSRV
jgi:hypothetical protein